ncbi:MAG: chemotaxis protein CheW [Acaryochloridaceae cyanobacterium CSU_3_4]|nr:chemotaxis protein CheW [Acaryochloridaceae cyanobacterium CSU_3_4]
MAIISSVRLRRGVNRPVEATEQLIAFKLRGEWFALSLAAVQKVIPLGTVHGDPNNTGISLTLYQGQEIVVVDVGHRIFKETAQAVVSRPGKTASPNAQESPSASQQQRCLVLIQNTAGEVVGVPIDSQPLIRQVPQSSFSPLPSAYLNRGNIHCVSSMIADDGGRQPLFLLDPERLSTIKEERVCQKSNQRQS